MKTPQILPEKLNDNPRGKVLSRELVLKKNLFCLLAARGAASL
jgi:hypothetical protein